MDLSASAPLVLAAGGLSPLVADLGLCLVAAGVLAIAFVKLRIPAIAALLGAGVLLGPAGLAAIEDRESIDTIANLGLTLLLFVIGLEVNLKSLLASGRTLVLTGLVQVPLTLAAGLGAFLVIGLPGSGSSTASTRRSTSASPARSRRRCSSSSTSRSTSCSTPSAAASRSGC